MSCGAPPWAADPWRPEQSLAQLAGAAVPFPTFRKAPASGFLPAWQELQLQQVQQRAQDWLPTPWRPEAAAAPPPQTTPLPAQGTQGTQGYQGGLVFPGELTNEKERRRKQQQEMQLALAEQIKEQKARKERHTRYSEGPTNPLTNPLGTPRAAPDEERERKRLQQQELQRALAAQVEEARQRKEEARRRQEAEEAKEEERLRREIAEEKLPAKRPEGRETRRRDRESDMYRTRDTQGRDVRETEPGRTMKKTRDRLREEDGERGLRKTRERRSRDRRSRPRTRDSASPQRDAPSPIPSTAYGPADTAGTWVGTCSPSPARRDGEFGFHGFVEQQRQLASEMQRQVAELKSQRDQARQEALKVKEDAMNDRARHLQELQQVLADQLQVKPDVRVEAPKVEEEVMERSIVSDSCFVAIDAALTALLSRTLVTECQAEKLAEWTEFTAAPEGHALTRQSEASGSPGTEQLNKEKVAAFRKALDTADGLPAELRQDLCALLEESTPAESPSETGPTPLRPPLGKGEAPGLTPPFPHRASTRPRAHSTGSKLTSRNMGKLGEERAQSATSTGREAERPRRRSEALVAAASSVLAR